MKGLEGEQSALSAEENEARERRAYRRGFAAGSVKLEYQKRKTGLRSSAFLNYTTPTVIVEAVEPDILLALTSLLLV